MFLPATPGAYLQRLDTTSHPIASLRTDIPGFVGIAEQGPLDTPVAVESFKQFQALFGNFIGAGFLAYAVRAFFENGGQRARIVRIASRDPAGGALPASLSITNEQGGPAWTITASSPGTWGNALAVAILPKTRAETLVDTGGSTPQAAAVASTANIAPLSLVRIRQSGMTPLIRVVAAVDAVASLIYWINPDPNQRRLYEQQVSGLIPVCRS